MKKALRILSLLLIFSLTLGTSAALATDTALPESTEIQAAESIDPAEVVRAIVLFEGDGAAAVAEDPEDSLFSAQTETLEEDHEDLLETMEDVAPTLEVAHEFTVFFSGVSVDVPYGDLDALSQLEGVAEVWVATTYQIPTTEETSADELYAAASALSSEYTGQGTLIAVLDSGANLSHETFAVNDTMLGNTALSKSAAASASTSKKGQYVSKKIPFAYDYADNDSNVSDTHGHGTHVAAIAAGYTPAKGQNSGFSGAAPGAQLAIMKICKDNSDSTTTDVYFAALEDAYRLGVDVITMSLGSACGFTHDATLDSTLFGNIYRTLDEAGIIVCAASGNHGSQAANNRTSSGTVLADYTDYGTVASPASYLGNTAVAAATNTEYPSYAIRVDGTYYSYTEPSGASGSLSAALGGSTQPYVLVSGYGTAADFAAANVRGKIAVVSRGELSFAEKAQNAKAAGAGALVIYNNQSITVPMKCPDPAIPVILVSKTTGQILKNASAQTMYITSEQISLTSEASLSIAAYSAWGTTPDLTITPAISAIGTNVYSANYSGSSSYRYLSGTSMASPNVAGQFAVILSYLKSTQPTLSKLQRAELAEDLAYSSAQLLGSEESPISVRQQGSGLMDAATAVQNQFYFSEPLQELGDDPNETGVYTMTLEIQPTNNGCLSRRFTDVSTSSYYHEAVDYGVQTGLFKGTSNTTFAPEDKVTRAQVVTVLYRLSGSPTVSGKSRFTDVEAGSYYEDAVIWGQATGVVKGITDTTFCPNDPVTRQQMVTFLYRYLGSPATEMNLSGYVDTKEVDAYALPAMKWAVKNGIITSYATWQLQLNPTGKATRAQYATILYRYLNPSYDLSALVMGDSAIVQEDGTITNLMTSKLLDCNVTFSCGDSLTLSACGNASTSVTATIRLTEATKSTLRNCFKNGTYIEGYILLDGEALSIHSTFLSFFGDWEKAPILEQADFRDVEEAQDRIDAQSLRVNWYDLKPVNIDANMAYFYGTDGSKIILGDNPCGNSSYNRSHIALTSDENLARKLYLQTVQLRNAQSLTLTVTDADTRKVYYQDTKNYVKKTYYSGGWKYSTPFEWTPKDTDGSPLPSGTNLIVSVSASLHGETETLQWSFPLVIDSTAPTVTYSISGSSLTIKASDNEYLACISVTYADGNTLKETLYSDSAAKKSHSVTVDVSGLSGSVTINATDYATNVRTETILLS